MTLAENPLRSFHCHKATHKTKPERHKTMQSDSYENAVAMHGMTAAEYAQQQGCEIWEIPLAERLKLALKTVVAVAPALPAIPPAVESPRVELPAPPAEIEIELDFDGGEEAEEENQIENDVLLDIGETLEIFGIDFFHSRNSLTLTNGDGTEVEIPRSKAEKSAYKAILESLTPLGLWHKRREIRTDWKLMHS